MTPSNGPLRPRHVAADAVGRVVRTGAYSNVVVPAVSSDLTSGEQRRVKALVYGVLRHLATIDREIESAAGRSPSEIDDEVLDRLRVSVLEVLYSETPKPVAVSAGVDLVRETRPKAAGFANAVLRQVSTRDHAPEAMDLPSWLVSSLSAHWASEQIDRFALASAQEPPRVVRYRPGTETVGTPVAGVDGAFAIEPGPLPEGAVVQDAASIAATSALSAEPGMVVADLAAALTRAMQDNVPVR